MSSGELRAVGHDDGDGVALEHVEPSTHRESVSPWVVREVIAHPRILGGKRPDHCRGVISACVVDDEDLVLDRGPLELLSDPLYRLLNAARFVVSGNDNRERSVG